MLIDSFYTSKNSLSFSIIQKFGYNSNIYNMPQLKKVHLFFYLRKLEDLDEVQIYNYFYLLKFFFGRIAFLSKIRKFFLLGTWYYNFQVQFLSNKSSEINMFLNQFFNNILPRADNSLWKSSWNPKYVNIFYYLVKDVNMFSELKTNLGLFYLKKPLSINLIFRGFDIKLNSIYLSVHRFL